MFNIVKAPNYGAFCLILLPPQKLQAAPEDAARD